MIVFCLWRWCGSPFLPRLLGCRFLPGVLVIRRLLGVRRGLWGQEDQVDPERKVKKMQKESSVSIKTQLHRIKMTVWMWMCTIWPTSPVSPFSPVGPGKPCTQTQPVKNQPQLILTSSILSERHKQHLQSISLPQSDRFPRWGFYPSGIN